MVSVNLELSHWCSLVSDLKEHVAITIMSSTASAAALAISIFGELSGCKVAQSWYNYSSASQDLYYNVEVNPGVGIFTWASFENLFDALLYSLRNSLIASQLLGYGIAGMFRAFLVHPTFAIYPQVMPQVQL